MIKNTTEARNCINACATYLQKKDESPLAASDLWEAVNMLVNARIFRVIVRQETTDTALAVVRVDSHPEGLVVWVQ